MVKFWLELYLYFHLGIYVLWVTMLVACLIEQRYWQLPFYLFGAWISSKPIKGRST